MIEITDLKKNYKGSFQLNIQKLHVRKGDIIGFVGNNGAGKTTLFRLILDLIKRDSGKILIEGQDVKSSDTWRQNTSCFLDEGFLLSYLSVNEFISFKASVYQMLQDDIKREIEKWGTLLEDDPSIYKKMIKDLSTGNKQKVGIISAAMVNPSLLILDEPFNYLDPSSQIDVMKLLTKLNVEKGTTILLSSHNLEYVSDISSQVVLLENGSILKEFDTASDDVASSLKDYFYFRSKDA